MLFVLVCLLSFFSSEDILGLDSPRQCQALPWAPQLGKVLCLASGWLASQIMRLLAKRRGRGKEARKARRAPGSCFSLIFYFDFTSKHPRDLCIPQPCQKAAPVSWSCRCCLVGVYHHHQYQVRLLASYPSPNL